MPPRDRDVRTRLDQSAIHLLHRVSQCAGEVFAEELEASGLTARQFAVLFTISEDEGLSQTSLVHRTGIDRSTLADIIRRMIRKGYVRRQRTRQDARVYAVHLTESGRFTLNAAQPAASNADQRVLAFLPPSRRDEFLETLNTIVRTFTLSGG